MKKILFFIVLLSLNISNLYAQQWEPLGPNDFEKEDGFPLGQFGCPTLAIDHTGIPYVAFTTYENNITVLKFNGVSWVNVGNSDDLRGYAMCGKNIAIDPNGIPYVVFMNEVYNSKVSVKKFINSKWIDVGTAISDKTGNYSSISIDKSGIPYVAYIESDSACSTTEKKKLAIKKFDGNSWVSLGVIGNTVWNPCGFAIPSPSFVISSSGTPFVAFMDEDNGSKITVKKLNEDTWVNVGSPWDINWEHPSPPSTILLAVDNSDNPYLAYCGHIFFTDQPLIIKKYTGSSWVDISNTVGSGHTASMVISTSGILYVAYTCNSLNRAIVKKFDGTSWLQVGGDVSSGYSNYNSLDVDSSDNLILVYNTGSLYAKKFKTAALAVDSFDNGNVLLYPNPVKDNLNIDVSDDLNNYSIEIFDMLGRNIYKNSMHGKIKSINLERLTTGVYNIRLTGNNKQIVKKIIKL